MPALLKLRLELGTQRASSLLKLLENSLKRALPEWCWYTVYILTTSPDEALKNENHIQMSRRGRLCHLLRRGLGRAVEMTCPWREGSWGMFFPLVSQEGQSPTARSGSALSLRLRAETGRKCPSLTWASLLSGSEGREVSSRGVLITQLTPRKSESLVVWGMSAYGPLTACPRTPELGKDMVLEAHLQIPGGSYKPCPGSV